MSGTDSENEYESADDDDSLKVEVNKSQQDSPARSDKAKNSENEAPKEKKNVSSDNDQMITKSVDTVQEQKTEIKHDNAIEEPDNTIQHQDSIIQKPHITNQKQKLENSTQEQRLKQTTQDLRLEQKTQEQRLEQTTQEQKLEHNIQELRLEHTTQEHDDIIPEEHNDIIPEEPDDIIPEEHDDIIPEEHDDIIPEEHDDIIPENHTTIQEQKMEINLDELSNKSDAKGSKNVTWEEKEKVTNVIDTQPRRVTLRLEKKAQEKHQAAATVKSSNTGEEYDKLLEKVPSSSWGFGSWGSSLLSTAASSVSTFTNQVSQGIGTVLETVENSLGAPAPEDLATLLKERKELNENSNEEEIISPREAYLDDDDEDGVPATSSLFTGVTTLTKAIESTGGKVLMGGLDALEMIGKKTIDILTEGDPGLRNKRATLSGNATLSQLLREAKNKTDEDQANTSMENQEQTIHFTSYFDDFQGLIHLEALEMLSSQCQNKVHGALMITSGDSSVKDNLNEVKRICEDLPSVDETSDDKTQDFEACLFEHMKSLQLQVDAEKIKNVRNSIHEQLDKCISEQEIGEVKDAKELYREAISSLAEFSAKCVEQFHKLGELILVQTDSNFDVLACATHLTGLTTVLCVEVGIISNKYCQCLNTAADDSEDPDLITPLITTVYLESSNSSTYIQDAFQLLTPVLQAFLLQ